jgi:predicted amidophosphoribosyltransferase
MKAETLLELCMHMVWPVSCPVCGRVGVLLCEPCLRSLLKPQLPRCLLCGKPIPCGLHRESPKIRAASAYEGGMRELVLMLKQEGYEALGFRIGRACAEVFAAVRPKADLLVPTPLHQKSKRRYNQALAVAKGLGGAWGIEALDAARWTADVATRRGLSAAEREALAPDVFRFEEGLAGLRAALVDDVCTTGSTLSRLAAAARRAGIEVTDAFVVAGARG